MCSTSDPHTTPPLAAPGCHPSYCPRCLGKAPCQTCQAWVPHHRLYQPCTVICMQKSKSLCAEKISDALWTWAITGIHQCGQGSSRGLHKVVPHALLCCSPIAARGWPTVLAPLVALHSVRAAAQQVFQTSSLQLPHEQHSFRASCRSTDSRDQESLHLSQESRRPLAGSQTDSSKAVAQMLSGVLHH